MRQDTGDRTLETGHIRQDTGDRTHQTVYRAAHSDQDRVHRSEDTGHRTQHAGHRTHGRGYRTLHTEQSGQNTGQMTVNTEDAVYLPAEIATLDLPTDAVAHLPYCEMGSPQLHSFMPQVCDAHAAGLMLPEALGVNKTHRALDVANLTEHIANTWWYSPEGQVAEWVVPVLLQCTLNAQKEVRATKCAGRSAQGTGHTAQDT